MRDIACFFWYLFGYFMVFQSISKIHGKPNKFYVPRNPHGIFTYWEYLRRDPRKTAWKIGDQVRIPKSVIGKFTGQFPSENHQPEILHANQIEDISQIF